MRDLGFTPYAEVSCVGYTIDLVGRKGTELLAVEMKRTLSGAVIRQAYRCDLFTRLRYAAVGTKPRAAGVARCQRVGVGLLSVVGDQVTVLVEPGAADGRGTPQFDGHYARAMHKVLDAREPGGVGGVPCTKGVGPAQECFERVTAYRQTRPLASWREIFENVPNHYANHASLRGAMTVVQNGRFSSEPLTLEGLA
ncbi:MAG TPA: hypothetical protein VK421_06175 [Pyrinomonadaceae bacterium]|nr:hypothetical protein [Pyrinomonadaceae bacterium]